MMATMLADMQITLQIAMENHLVAFWAFLPQVFWNVRLFHEGAKFGTNEIRKPIQEV